VADRVKQTEDKIAQMLKDATLSDCPNRISVQELRDWATKYLQEHDEELKCFPEDAGMRHWNLWMNDTRSEDALFAVLVFFPEEVEFFCGTGDSFKVRHFCGHDFPNDLRELFDAMRKLFTIADKPIRLDRATAERWLGRKL
jgi:hypothetical protein